MHLFDSAEPKKMIIHSNMINKMTIIKNFVFDFDLVAWLWCVNDLITINKKIKKFIKIKLFFLSTAGENETPK